MHPSPQLFWMLLEAFLMGTLLYALVRFKKRLTLVPLAAFVAGLQFPQVVLALTLYVEVFPGLVVSPGSVVIFPATLLGVLLMYIADEADGARALIVGLIVSNVSISFLSLATGLSLLGPNVQAAVEVPKELFLQNPRVMVVGTLALIADSIAVILVYEAASRLKSVFARVWLSLAAVLVLDSVLFVTGAFAESERFAVLLGSAIAGKLLFSIPYAAAIALFHRFVPQGGATQETTVRDAFHMLTYRERYRKAHAESLQDDLTGLQNRRAFDAVSEELAATNRWSVLLIDADQFKKVNDDFGHAVGDSVLKRLGGALRASLRTGDTAYRYGGEEFAILLQDADVQGAVKVGKRVRGQVSKAFLKHPLPDGRSLSVTIGVGSAPEDGLTVEDVIRIADSNLYDGKRAGRDQVVSSIPPGPRHPSKPASPRC